MNKNMRIVFLTLIGTCAGIVIFYFTYRVLMSRQKCPDGTTRVQIDVASFETQYSGYSMKLEAKLRKDASLTAELDPVKQREISEAMQSARLQLQALAAGYNTCAVTAAQFNQARDRFQRMEGLAQRIEQLSAQRPAGPKTNEMISAYVSEYVRLARE
jgi:hypothetical protein